MCGIAGLISLNGTHVRENELKSFAKYLQERGPDFTGYWNNEILGFCHTRLSILDLDARSNQPMLSSDKNVIIVFNGEIYNFKELKADLQKSGVIFSTNSDTEVIIQAYTQWGIERTVQKLDGMFAFALYDLKASKVYFARDPFGKKPFYYLIDNEKCVFSSDIRVIHSHCKASLTLDYDSIDYFLSELAMPQPNTIWKEVKQLKPAHFITLDVEKKSTIEKRYWSLSQEASEQLSFNCVLDKTESILKKAILKRTISDVPIGCFLSGGVDSGLVVALLAQSSSEKVNTFSVGVKSDKMNELPLARKVAERYKTNHNELIVDLSSIDDLPKLIDYLGEPFADSSILPSFYINQAISSSVKVALSGDGGDELFGGYPEYGLSFRSEQFIGNYPNPFKRELIVATDKVKSRFSKGKENFGSLKHYAKLLPSQKLFRNMGFNAAQKQHLYAKEFGSLVLNSTDDFLTNVWADNLLNGTTKTLLKTSLNTRLLNDYLVKVDRSSMLNSVEVRSPLLDKELAEWAFSLPVDQLFYNNTNKSILKHLAIKHLDKDILKRPKTGFSIPVQEWLQKDLLQWMKSILLDSRCRERHLFNQSYIEKLISEHQNNGAHTHRLWSLICLELWFQKFID